MAVITFLAEDNSFAVSTGDNVNSGNGTSTYNHPPNSTFNLTITSNPDAPDPRVFEVGDTYDITFSGNSGTLLEDAVVVRSDQSFGDTPNMIVFEGTDPDGALVQVVWAPNFDLESWYQDNFHPSSPPGFYTTDQTVDDNYKFVCFASGTEIDTPKGPVPVEHLAPGDRISTVDDGATAILWRGQATVPGRRCMAPVMVETGVLENDRPLLLSQQHRVLVDGAHAELLFGQPEALAPVKALTLRHDVRVTRQRRVTYHHILLPRHGLLRANGAICESLFPGDVARSFLSKRANAEVTRCLASKSASADRHPARPILKTHEVALWRKISVAPTHH